MLLQAWLVMLMLTPTYLRAIVENVVASGYVDQPIDSNCS